MFKVQGEFIRDGNADRELGHLFGGLECEPLNRVPEARHGRVAMLRIARLEVHL